MPKIGKGSGAQISDLRRSPQVGLAAPAKTILNALSRVWISASLDATIGKHVQSRRASLVLGGPARPSNNLQCFAVRFRCWLSPSFLLSGMLLAIGCAPVVVSQLLDRYVRGTGRHRWGNDRVNSFAGRAVDRAARSWRFDRRAPAFCWQRAGTRSSRRRGMEVGAVAAVAARWVPPIGQHLGCAPRSRRQRGHACHPRSPPPVLVSASYTSFPSFACLSSHDVRPPAPG